MKASGVNPVDIFIREGKFGTHNLPFVPGCEGAGIVVKVGSKCQNFKVHFEMFMLFSPIIILDKW